MEAVWTIIEARKLVLNGGGTKKISVCHLISGDLWAGAESQAYSLVREINKCEQVKLKVVTFNYGMLHSRLESLGVDLEIIDESRSYFILLWHLLNIIKKNKVQILHVHGYKESFLGGIASFFCTKVKIVRTFHGKGLLSSNYRNLLIEKINKLFFCNHMIAVSADLKKILISLGYDGNKISVIKNGIDTKYIKLDDAFKIKNDLGIPNNCYIVGTLGRMVSVKGHEYFLEGAREVILIHSSVRFIICGDGPLMDSSISWIRKNKLCGNIIVTGFRDDPYNVLNIFDIFALTSLHEGLPMALLEAMSLGKPVISTDVGGVSEVITNRYNGILIPPENTKNFSDACLLLMNDDALRKKISDNARNTVIDDYSVEEVAQKVIKLYFEKVIRDANIVYLGC